MEEQILKLQQEIQELKRNQLQINIDPQILNLLKRYTAIPYTTTVPTHKPIDGTAYFVSAGGTFNLYIYTSANGWKKSGNFS